MNKVSTDDHPAELNVVIRNLTDAEFVKLPSRASISLLNLPRLMVIIIRSK